MDSKENQIYFQKAAEIKDQVYGFYNIADREDLVMVYEMREDKVYAYLYDDFRDILSQSSQDVLAKQYHEAKESDKIVLFIRDELRGKLKSFVI